MFFYLVCVLTVGLAFGNPCQDQPDYAIPEHGCKSYTVCFSGIPYQQDCIGNLVFNKETGKCDSPENVGPPCGEWRDCTGKTGQYADLESQCAAFYTCLDGHFMGFNECAPGTVFDERDRSCNWPFNVPPPCGTLELHFLVCNPANGSFITQRQEPKMALVSANIDQVTGSLLCKAPGFDVLKVQLEGHERSTVMRCRVWDDHLNGAYCGEEAEEWFTKYLGRPACLVFAAPGLKKRHLQELKSSKWHALTQPHDKVAFADFATYLLASDASLADLNSRLTKQLPMENFRPNIVVDASKAYEEDDWDEIYIGDSRFRHLKPCARCVMTTVDREKGEKDPTQEPLKTMRQYRMKPDIKPGEIFFGINLFADFSSKISIGQPVYATLKKLNN